MAKLKAIEPLVKEILEKYEETRNDDFLLISHVYYRLCHEVSSASFTAVMLSHKELDLPSFKSITRARRKIQAEYYDLKPREEIQEIKKLEEQEYINYSRSR